MTPIASRMARKALSCHLCQHIRFSIPEIRSELFGMLAALAMPGNP